MKTKKTKDPTTLEEIFGLARTDAAWAAALHTMVDRIASHGLLPVAPLAALGESDVYACRVHLSLMVGEGYAEGDAKELLLNEIMFVRRGG